MTGLTQRYAEDVERGPLALHNKTVTGIVLTAAYDFDDTHATAADVTAFEVAGAGYERLTATARVERIAGSGRWDVYFDDVTTTDLSDVDNRGGIAWFLPGDTDAERASVGFNEDLGPAVAEYAPTYDDAFYQCTIKAITDLKVAGVGLDENLNIPTELLKAALELAIGIDHDVDGGDVAGLLDKIQVRSDFASTWTAENPTLRAREIAFELDTRQLKIGDGTTAWNDLAYAGSSPNASTTVGAFILVDNDAPDPTTVPFLGLPGAPYYFFSNTSIDGEGDPWPHAGLYLGTSDGVTPAPLVLAPHQPKTGDVFESRSFVNLSSDTYDQPWANTEHFGLRVGYVRLGQATQEPDVDQPVLSLLMEYGWDVLAGPTAADITPTGSVDHLVADTDMAGGDWTTLDVVAVDGNVLTAGVARADLVGLRVLVTAGNAGIWTVTDWDGTGDPVPCVPDRPQPRVDQVIAAKLDGSGPRTLLIGRGSPGEAATSWTLAGDGGGSGGGAVDSVDGLTGAVDLSGSYVPLSSVGTADGVAELDSAGLVPSARLPSYVDDVIEAANFAALPGTGTTGKIYVTLDTNLTYRWSGSVYVEISASLALGETSSTAYRGDRGKTAYDHSQATGNPHGVTKGEVGLANVDNTSNATERAATATLANKRVTPRVLSSATPGATPAINTDNYDAVYFSAIDAAITSMSTNLTGAPALLEKLLFRIKDDGTARAITWGASFEAKGVALPTTTVAGKALTVMFLWSTATSKWGCVAAVSEA